MEIRSYRDLKVWQVAMDLVVLIYQRTSTFPNDEKYGLISQMRRSAISIPSNIAEGSRRNTPRDYAHFVAIAYGSGAELETQLELARRLEMLTEKEFEESSSKLTDVMKMLNGLRASLRS
jgi:four helix bundle protein